MTRADSGMLDGKSTEEKIIKLNLEKRKSLMKIESRREIIGDEVANKMIESIEANYQKQLSQTSLLENSP